jgi:hypothetical protein
MTCAIRFYHDSRITIQRLGEEEKEHPYVHEDKNFAGDCVFATQRHFIDNLLSGKEFETNGKDYLRSLAVQEAVYGSAAARLPVEPRYPVFTGTGD